MLSDASKMDELEDCLNSNDEEIDKFILMLWKVLLKEALDSSRVDLYTKISQNCPNFLPKLVTFLTARCRTFKNLPDEIYRPDVKERLGKVVTLVAEMYARNLVTGERLKMWIQRRLAAKIPTDFISNILVSLKGWKRLDKYKHKELRTLIADIVNLQRKIK